MKSMVTAEEIDTPIHEIFSKKELLVFSINDFIPN